MGGKEEDGGSSWGKKRKKMRIKRCMTVTWPVDRFLVVHGGKCNYPLLLVSLISSFYIYIYFFWLAHNIILITHPSDVHTHTFPFSFLSIFTSCFFLFLPLHSFLSFRSLLLPCTVGLTHRRGEREREAYQELLLLLLSFGFSFMM